MNVRFTLRKFLILPFAVTVILMIAGCSAAAPKINADEILHALLEKINYASVLTDAGENARFYFPDLPEGSKAVLYIGSGYNADEVAMLTLPEESDANQAKAVAEKHLQELRGQYQNYLPEELQKINHAVVWQNGKYLFLCITADYEKAQELFSHTDDLENFTVPDVSGVPVPPTSDSPVIPYPVLQSQSGSYYDYGNYVVRVDQSAFECYEYVDSTAESYAQLINRAADALAGKTTVYDLPIPTAIGVVFPDDIAKMLPAFPDQGAAVNQILSKMNSHVVPVDCFDNLMQHRDEALYFHTDYHWNGKGAYYAYESFCRTKGIRPIPLAERKCITFNNYLGALYWSHCDEDPILKKNPDTIEAYYPKSVNATMEYTDQHGETHPWNIIMDVSDWDEASKYNTFAGSDNPFAVFHNPDAEQDNVCVIVKESFGNVLLPYLVDHYRTIYEIDYRYWQGDLIKFVSDKKADDLLFANNLSMITSNYLIGQLSEIIH